VSALAPAVWPGEDVSATRLLHVDPARGAFRDASISDLATLLRPADLLVLNDAATIPASLAGRTRHGPVEVRLAGLPRDVDGRGPWPAVLFGTGSWRQRTEDRPPPPRLAVGDVVELEAPGGEVGLSGEVVGLSSLSPRLVDLKLDREGSALWRSLFRVGRPVQYSYLQRPLPLWHVQTPFAGRPMAVEMPSAGRPLRLPLLRALQRRGVALATVTHAAGLSSTGDPAIDAALPLPERSVVPQETVEAVERTATAGGLVVATGTTVVRALEGAWSRTDGLRAGTATADLRIGRGFTPRVVSGLLTGLHQPGESHFELLQAFAPGSLLAAALDHAARAGYRSHEFGDASLVLSTGNPA
jgi:S-adenosylmethionine:tRNA ribosyltransferase-isomerase